MYSFKNDYSEGAHPQILNALIETNLVQEDGYGEDQYSLQAAKLLREKMNDDEVAIHFLTGGTQANLTAIAAFLRPHEAAVAAATGHINVHETGAIEATGHKVLAVPSGKDGKLTPTGIQSLLDAHPDEHMVKPKLVYISDTTENGAVYTKKELEALNAFCKNRHLYLYLDGARLGSALTSPANDLQLSDLPKLVDAFYVGGTKNGALIGEALVICNDALKDDFRFIMKQRGAMLAKGRLTGIQFLVLFRDNLFFDLAAHANAMALKLSNAIQEAGYAFLTPPVSNQIFPILPHSLLDTLHQQFHFFDWEKIDHEHSAARLVTSWATKEEAIDAFIASLKEKVTR
ncbi:aminotransferase class I/II-fold pyridoxal phosphate-dependent enzyme [Sporolactobacillus sp. CPB3-1]|uniref:Aminotransferase class I/II-fold pyridoxal phosphate-dependent enzyme n=1 Tax=Sporolactobacillus mangiferae TaxID=2940498 RepID=A0ABT0MD85_9BACL|nr:aminotransferase class I/II-fold pyridoxal phosphate-dependent enzyme [Sporolactobacillus mangiferae]MCL1632832.1 aminotransferase class I/II-fold pyridoxal phosphate-dependent enzyme [Sporolactobacillus mangiferae]